MNFIAKKDNHNLKLMADGVHFGTLVNCEWTFIFESLDTQLQDWVNQKLEGDMSAREMLVVCKECFIALQAQYDGETQAEAASERAYYNTIEYDQEAQDEMYRDDAMGRS